MTRCKKSWRWCSISSTRLIRRGKRCPESERSWFDQALAGERAVVDSAVQYVATLKGSGAIAQGTGAVAAGRGGVAIGGNVYGNVVNSKETLSPEDEEAMRQGIEDVQRGDVRPWSQVKHDLGL